MRKNILVVMLIAGAVCIGGVFTGASSVMAVEEVQAKAVEAGNKVCPVLGNPVSSEVKVEYKGKIYHFCCPMCVATFNQDPEKYSKIADEEIAAAKAK